MYQAIKWSIQRISDEAFLSDPSEGYSFYYVKEPGYFLDTELDAKFMLEELADPQNHRIVKFHITIYKAL